MGYYMHVSDTPSTDSRKMVVPEKEKMDEYLSLICRPQNNITILPDGQIEFSEKWKMMQEGLVNMLKQFSSYDGMELEEALNMLRAGDKANG